MSNEVTIPFAGSGKSSPIIIHGILLNKQGKSKHTINEQNKTYLTLTLKPEA